MSRWTIRSKYRMAMANALFPPSLWPLGRTHHRHSLTRITKVAGLERKGGTSESDSSETSCEWERG